MGSPCVTAEQPLALVMSRLAAVVAGKGVVGPGDQQVLAR